MPVFKAADRWLQSLANRNGRVPKPLLVATSFLATGMLGWVDLAAGPHITFAVFYLIPVALLTWYVGRPIGLAMATLCGSLWFFDTIPALPRDLPPVVVGWAAINKVTLFVLAMWLVGALRDALEHHRRLAGTDDMTGVANRRSYFAAASREISRSRRTGAPITVVYADCDNLKKVNDQLGHLVGDQVIRTVAQTLQRHVREADMVARIGGDEFAILLPETDAEQAQAVTRKLTQRVGEALVERGWNVTLSVGVVTFNEPPDSPEQLLGQADSLQYSVKHGRKNDMAFQSVGRARRAA